jgi:hypothetical protein
LERKQYDLSSLSRLFDTVPPLSLSSQPATGPSAPAPRSGLERSDFVQWPKRRSRNVCSRVAVGGSAVHALIDQLQDQLRNERAQHRFNLAKNERELALALRELAELWLKLARIEAFASAPSPSTLLY